MIMPLISMVIHQLSTIFCTEHISSIAYLLILLTTLDIKLLYICVFCACTYEFLHENVKLTVQIYVLAIANETLSLFKVICVKE